MSRSHFHYHFIIQPSSFTIIEKSTILKMISLLTSEEASAVEFTWSKIAQDLKGNSVKVFMSFLAKYPHHQEKFRSFATLPLSELPQNKRFQAHTFTAVSTLDSLLSTLDDEEIFWEMMAKIGENHAKRHGVTASDFGDFMRVLSQLMANTLGETVWTPEAKSGWDKVGNAIVKGVTGGIVM